MNSLRPDLLYRAFRPNHLAKAPMGLRLMSGFFKGSDGVSVYLGEKHTLLEVAEEHHDCGVASIPISLLQKLGFVLEVDPTDDADTLPGHRIFRQPSRDRGAELSQAAVIEIALRGYAVIGANQSQGVPNPFAKDPVCSQ